MKPQRLAVTGPGYFKREHVVFESRMDDRSLLGADNFFILIDVEDDDAAEFAGAVGDAKRDRGQTVGEPLPAQTPAAGEAACNAATAITIAIGNHTNFMACASLLLAQGRRAHLTALESFARSRRRRAYASSPHAPRSPRM